MRTQRDALAKTLIELGKETPDFEKKVAQFEELEMQIEAYVDVLTTIEQRIEFEEMLKQQKKVQDYLYQTIEDAGKWLLNKALPSKK